MEVHPLIIITCGSLSSSTDSGTRVDQMRCPWPCTASMSTVYAVRLVLPG